MFSIIYINFKNIIVGVKQKSRNTLWNYLKKRKNIMCRNITCIESKLTIP